jgi:hypothetical protein
LDTTLPNTSRCSLRCKSGFGEQLRREGGVAVSTEIPGSAPVEGRDSSRSRKMTSHRPARDDFRGRKKDNCPSKELLQTDHPRRQTENSCPIAHRKGFRFNDHGFRKEI